MNNIIKSTELFDKNDMKEEEIFSFVQTFLKKLPNSLDPLNKNFIPVFPIFKIPSDLKEYRDQMSAYESLKKWSDTRRTAYSIRLYAQLQFALLTNDINQLNKEDIFDKKVWGLNEQDSDSVKEALLLISSFAEKILNSDSEERKLYLEQASYTIRKISGIFSPQQDVDMYCYFEHINYSNDICLNLIEESKIKKIK